jgi:hypothetical protein
MRFRAAIGTVLIRRSGTSSSSSALSTEADRVSESRQGDAKNEGELSRRFSDNGRKTPRHTASNLKVHKISESGDAPVVEARCDGS